MTPPPVDAPALYLPDVEARHQPGAYATLVAAARAEGGEWITATGVPQMSDAAHRAQGQALAARGYTRSE